MATTTAGLTDAERAVVLRVLAAEAVRLIELESPTTRDVWEAARIESAITKIDSEGRRGAMQ